MFFINLIITIEHQSTKIFWLYYYSIYIIQFLLPFQIFSDYGYIENYNGENSKKKYKE